MTETFKPQTAVDVRDAIRWALDAETTLEVRSAGTKRRLGRPTKTPALLDLSGLSSVTLYEPEELVVSLQPGAPRAEVEALLGRSGQMLAFEPPDFGPLFGADKDRDTMGGTIGINAAGPRRLKAGSARDFVLGVKGVSGFGDEFRSGGRVVKNVSGYDLGKLLTGSYGTLAALTEVTLKVLPRPETETTIMVAGLDAEAACTVLRKAAAHPAEGSGFAYLPQPVAGRSPTPGVESATLIRFEGPSASLDARLDAVSREMPWAAVLRLPEDVSRAVWRAIRDVAPLSPPDHLPLWRISVPPNDATCVLDENPSPFAALDWAGGLIWLSSDTAPMLRRGSATLFRASDEARARLPFLPTKDDALGALVKRVKASFDPKGLLNPGRMYEGV